MSTHVADSTKEKLKELVEYYLNVKKPTAIETISISEINFGDIPPSFSVLRGIKPPFPDLGTVLVRNDAGHTLCLSDLSVEPAAAVRVVARPLPRRTP